MRYRDRPGFIYSMRTHSCLAGRYPHDYVENRPLESRFCTCVYLLCSGIHVVFTQHTWVLSDCSANPNMPAQRRRLYKYTEPDTTIHQPDPQEYPIQDFYVGTAVTLLYVGFK